MAKWWTNCSARHAAPARSIVGLARLHLSPAEPCLQQAAQHENNHWVVKLARGARSSDVCLTSSASTVVRYRCVMQPCLPEPPVNVSSRLDGRSDCPCAQSLSCSQVAHVRGHPYGVLVLLSPTVSCHREAPGGDRVAQKYVHQPVLWQGRKFDLRVYILVSTILRLSIYCQLLDDSRRP